MLIGKFFKKKRIELGLDPIQLAHSIGPRMTTMWIFDFEIGDDDELDGFTIPEFKNICSALKVNPSEVPNIAVSDFLNLSLPDLIKNRREEKGYSIEDLAKRIGFKSIVIKNLENNENLNNVVINVLKGISKELDIPLELLFEKL